ncbi:3-methylcrotonyl-CoA carboxylase subunit alpha [Myriangium duriaei CBS 260.36]|uniref:3-methylcrotonyl-CoA carboxylase subunit alpha n=1 Tax=Myriangium duriaei CBS 260.36 TaxID=1168546 RepID=A0A9P4JCC9_9PEZI|nr:3-methylcrotonyl-CoA carboxylase subunit alpha [Myriangium duriaei CBS 260.36]
MLSKGQFLRSRALRVGGRRFWSTTSQLRQQAVTPLQSILIANRGEIALRVGRTASASGIKTTVLYTDPDARAQHALSSPFAINLGDPSRYLDGDYIIEVAKKHGCQGIHPGYGFLSENADFARKCTEAGLNFIGPPWKAVDAMGDKSRSKEIMTDAGVPCIPGYHGRNQDPAFLATEAEKIGYPVLLKAVKGGGGKGMRIAMTPDEFAAQLESAKSEARSSFGDDVMLVEKYITTPRHIEVQVFADKHGNAVALGERDCSIQRRHQKILEESPAPNLPEEIRQDLWEKARAAALAVNYEGAGTVEFIFDNDTGKFFFMEMNTRLQVEHPVTEMVTGEDLVQWQIQIAQGEKIRLTQEQIHEEIKKRGHAIEARIYAENPDMNFVPDSGALLHLQTPTPTDTVRIDAGFAEGDLVSSYYDPMIAKLIVQGPDRHTALQKLHAALESYQIAGPRSNIEFLKRMCVSPGFVKGDVETGYIQKNNDELFQRQVIEPELWMQAAIGLFLSENAAQGPSSLTSSALSSVGFGTGVSNRQFSLVELPADGKSDAATATVQVQQVAPGVLSISADGKDTIKVTSQFDAASKTIRTFFPHTRLETTFVRDPETNTLILFQQGRQYRVQLAVPKWAEKVLGMKDVKNSVLAPMPCKVLRVEVEEGATVKKNQPLVVIESMKMETVIRAPHDGVIAKVVHRAGDLCKAGTALVEFEETEA